MSNENIGATQCTQVTRENILNLISRQQMEYAHRAGVLEDLKDLIGMLPVTLNPDQETKICNIATQVIRHL